MEIGNFAFAHCVNLTEVDSETLKDHEGESGPAQGNHNHQMLQSIGYRAFHYCSLTGFNFNKHLVHIGEGAFRGNAIENINLSKCVELKKIPDQCFHEADGTIKSIILSVSIEEIGDYAFTGAAATTVFLGMNLKKVGHYAVSMAKLRVFIVPVSIETIYDDSFDFGSKGYTPIFVPARDLSKAEALIDLFETAGYEDFKQDNNVSKLYDDSVKYWESSSFCTDFLGGHVVDPTSSITRLEYPYGINHEGVAYGGACSVCGQGTESTQFTVRPILIAKGYSVCMFNGLYAFANGYEIYHNALHVYESVYGEVEIGILFLLGSRYSSVDLRQNIDSMGAALTQDQLPGSNLDAYVAIDYIFTYSKGIGPVVEGGTPRGDEPVIIAAYMLHKQDTENANGQIADVNKKGTSYYVQDTDELCILGQTSDKKFYTVSYNSIYGMIETLGLE